jgi:hypothetical protein
MANRCHFSHQKQDKKRGYLKNHSPKTYQLLLEIRESNQTTRIKCRSRENYQSRVHVGQTRNWNSVLQSTGCNPNATNRNEKNEIAKNAHSQDAQAQLPIRKEEGMAEKGGF